VVDVEKIKELRKKGKKVKEIAELFNVTPPAICNALKRQKKRVTSVTTLEHASEVAVRGVNALDQVQKINHHANWLLDHLMKWVRGDEEAIQVLESAKRMVNVGSKDEPEWVSEYKFKDPHELALKAMAEIRGQLKTQLEIFQAVYDVKAAEEFQKEVLEAIGEVAPDVRQRIVDNLTQKRIIRSAISIDR